MKQTPSEYIALLTAIKDGAEWEYLLPRSAPEVWEVNTNSRKAQFELACAYIAADYSIRLKPKPVMVPLGPEDWEGIWWVKRTVDIARQMVLVVRPYGIATRLLEPSFEELRSYFLRSRDGKNWEPCEKPQT